MSRYYLYRFFKNVTGFTVIEYLHSIRIIKAQKLLQETDLKIIEIAEKICFTNISNFGKYSSLLPICPLWSIAR